MPPPTITARERMLKSIRKGLIEKRENPWPELEVTPLYKDALVSYQLFEEGLTGVQGKFFHCASELAMVERLVELATHQVWPTILVGDPGLASFLDELDFPYDRGEEALLAADVSLTLCDALVARNGSVLISSGLESGRRSMIFPPVHVVVAHASQLVMDIKDALQVIAKKYKIMPSSLSFITGPSRTADIEKTLVLGAHGPKELIVLYVDTEERFIW